MMIALTLSVGRSRNSCRLIYSGSNKCLTKVDTPTLPSLRQLGGLPAITPIALHKRRRVDPSVAAEFVNSSRPIKSNPAHHAPGVRRIFFCFFAASGYLDQIERLLRCEFRADVCFSRKAWKRPPFVRHGWCPEVFRDVDGPRGEQPHVQDPAALFSVQASILHLEAGVSMPMRYL